MINVYSVIDEDTYFYVTEKWFSSDFHSLEQLADVGFDDPNKRPSESQDYPLLHPIYADCLLLVSIPSFDVLNEEHYPELFI